MSNSKVLPGNEAWLTGLRIQQKAEMAQARAKRKAEEAEEGVKRSKGERQRIVRAIDKAYAKGYKAGYAEAKRLLREALKGGEVKAKG